MSHKSKKGKKKSSRHTPIARHKRVGSKLLPPLAELPIVPTDWERDFLPEYLWIASLRDVTSVEKLHEPYYAFMDAVDEFWTEETPPLGLITDFGYLRPRSEEFLQKHGELVHDLFLEPIGRILAFYPESPARWLVPDKFLERGGSLDPQRELGHLRQLVVNLYSGRTELATAARMVLFGRILKHGRVKFAANLPTLDLLPRYPSDLNDGEKALVESFVRSGMGVILGTEPRYQDKAWPKYFWHHNYDLTVCRPALLPVRGGKPLQRDEIEEIAHLMSANTEAVRSYLDRLPGALRIDLYDPHRQEVLQGLFARLARFYFLIFDLPPLWARDTAGIMLRCMVETAITFCYLSTTATEEEFRQFIEYGEGQEKLLMLHLQDNHPDQPSLEGRTVEDFAEDASGFSTELLQIELGHWTKKDARKLAAAVGMESLYRIVFTPASGDVHGTWSSLKHSNLCHCAEPLHRYHRLPKYSEPPMYVNTLQAAQDVLLRAYEVARERLGLPEGLELESLLKPEKMKDTDSIG